MRCGRARQWMVAALDDELSSRRRRVLDRHLVRCGSCREEMAGTERLFRALAALPPEPAVPVPLEQSALRRVRVAAAEATERRGVPWFDLLVPAAAAAAVLAVALASTLGPFGREAGRDAAQRASGPVAVVGGHRPAAETARTASGAQPAVAAREGRLPPEAPPALAALPELFVDLPILRNLEKLTNFDAIRTTTLDDDAGGPAGEARSDG